MIAIEVDTNENAASDSSGIGRLPQMVISELEQDGPLLAQGTSTSATKPK
jgi:hypothetical protein